MGKDKNQRKESKGKPKGGNVKQSPPAKESGYKDRSMSTQRDQKQKR